MDEQAKQLQVTGIGAVAAGVALGLALWNLLDSFIRYLVCPLIAAFIGSSRFQLNSFTINTSEVPYGAFLESLFAALLVIWLVFLMLRKWRPSLGGMFAHRAEGSDDASG